MADPNLRKQLAGLFSGAEPASVDDADGGVSPSSSGASAPWQKPEGQIVDLDASELSAINRQLRQQVVENMQLFERAQASLAEAEFLYEASRELNMAQGYDDILDVLRQYTLLGQEMHVCDLYYFDRPWAGDQRPERMEILARWAQHPLEAVSAPYPMSGSLLEKERFDAPVLINVAEAEPSLSEDERLRYAAFGAKCVIYVPLEVQSQITAMIGGYLPHCATFSEPEQRRVVTLARQAAVMVQNLRNFALAEQRANEAHQWRAEQARLLEQLRQLSSAVEQSANTVVITDTEGYIEYVNPKFAETTGYSPAEVVGQHTRILKSGKTPPEVYKELWETITAGGEWRGEFLNKKKNSQLFWESVSISPLRNSDGEITHFLAVKEEISDRKRAEEALARRAAELETVARVSTVASTTLNVEELLQTVVDLTKSNFNLYHAHIYLLDEAGEALVLASGAGRVGRQMVAEGRRIPFAQKQSLMARAARTRRGVIVNNVRQDPGFLPHPALPATRAEMAVPMIVGAKVLGVLDVQADAVGRFDEEDIRVHTILAGQIAAALENARLFEKERQSAAEAEEQAKRLALLNEMAVELNLTTDLEEVFKIVASKTNLIVGGDRASLALLNPDGDSFKLLGLDGIKGSIPLRAQVPVEGTGIGQAAREKALIYTPDLTQSAFLDQQQLAEQGLRSTLIAPLLAAGQVIGTLNIGSQRLDAYNAQDESLLRQIASFLGTIVENRRLFNKMLEALAETQELYHAGRRISEATDLQEVVAAVAETISDPALNRVTVQIFDYDSAGEIEAMELVAAWHNEKGPPPDSVGTRYPPEVFGLLEALLVPEPSLLDDIRTDERLNPVAREMFLRVNLQALGVFPLWVGARQIGIMAIGFEEPHQFTEREAQIYSTMARQVAAAVENKRLLDEAQAALAEVEATQYRYTIQAWDKYRSRKPTLSYELLREDVTSLDDDLSVDVNQIMVQQKTMVISAPPDNGGSMSKIRSSLIAPITVRGAVVGVLGLQETDERQWSPEEISLVEAIIEQLSLAAENLRLIDETQQQAARESRINEIGEKIQMAQSLEEALQIAVKEVGLSLQAPQTMVQLAVDVED
ncbi:MAG: GAF domain-containing protein [Anaerolineae bacterium]